MHTKKKQLLPFQTSKRAFKHVASSHIDDPYIGEGAVDSIIEIADQFVKNLMDMSAIYAKQEGMKTIKRRHVLRATVAFKMGDLDGCKDE